MKISLTLPGQTILEVLIATTLISLSILAALSLNNHSQKVNSYARDLSSATTYNNQVIDWLRNLRTTIGWPSLAEALGADTAGNALTYCLNSIPSNTANFINLTDGSCVASSYIPNTTFVRQAVFDLTNIGNNSFLVTVTTSWQTHSTSTEATINNSKLP